MTVVSQTTARFQFFNVQIIKFVYYYLFKHLQFYLFYYNNKNPTKVLSVKQ